MKVAIIGGMALGCKAAARLRRIIPDAEITIFEKKPIISFGTCGMPFYTAGDIDDFNELMKTPWGSLRDNEYFRKVKAIDVRTETEVVQINPESNTIRYKEIRSNVISDFSYDYLVLGMGAEPIKAPYSMPQSPDISTYHSPFDAVKLRQLLQSGKIGSALIIGGAYIGCELAEALVSLWGIEVTIIEKEGRLMPGILDDDMSSLLYKLMEENGIIIRTGEKVNYIRSNDNGSLSVDIVDSESIECDHVINCLGIKPNIGLIHGTGIKIDDFGAIEVDGQLRTNISNIFAGGDLIRVKNLVSGQPSFFPLGSLANRQGRVIADSIACMETKFIGAVGTSSIKVFGMTFGTAGLNFEHACELSSDLGSIVGCWTDKPDFMPDVKNIFAKLIYCRKTQRVLGFQVAGRGEVTRYLDSMSVYLTHKSKIEDLLAHEHAYTPPHSQAINPLNHLAAMALADIRDGIKQSKLHSGARVIDLRDTAEIEAQPVPFETIAIPFEDLRTSMNGFDKSAQIQLLCQKGPRAFESAYVLKAAGFRDISYIGGGVQLVNAVLDRDVD